MPSTTIRVKGVDETVRAFGRMNHDLRREMQRGLQKAAKPVAETAKGKLARFRGASVSTIRPRVRGSRAVVEQRKGKVTGKRGDFGSIIMKRALIPALGERREDVIRELETVLDRFGASEGF